MKNTRNPLDISASKGPYLRPGKASTKVFPTCPFCTACEGRLQPFHKGKINV